MNMNNTLWIGLGNSAQAWYRCALPANHLDQDWVGMVGGAPGKSGIIIAGNLAEPVVDIDKYDNIIVELVNGQEWVDTVKEWRKQGKKVLYDCDDFIHGIHNINDHRFKSAFAKKRVKEYVEVMKVCDGIICSTEFLGNEYKKYNDNIYICKNGIDCGLYDVARPQREDGVIMIGWSGGTGHLQAIRSWFNKVIENMNAFENTNFISCGANYGDQLATIFPGRALSIPWTTIENYPYAISSFDISIAPSHVSKYFRSKSDLRWLESSAVGIPVIANPITYPEVEDGVTGMVAETPEVFDKKLEELIKDEELRREIGITAKKYIKKHRDISVMKNQWSEIL
jgi:glycosyltransferase involved in cell wall biosynthesis